LDGSSVRDVVVIEDAIIKGIILDVAANKMYWTDCGWSKIQRSNLDGSQIEDLVAANLVSPNAIDIDSKNGKIYWTDLGGKRLQRSNLDGTEVENIIAHELNKPQGLALRICEVNEDERSASCNDEVQNDSTTTSIDFIDNPSKIVLFPNPTRHQLSISNLEGHNDIFLFNQLGEMILQQKTQQAKVDFSVSHLPTGIYQIVVQERKGKMQALKLVIL